jgi:hypothetical protein
MLNANTITSQLVLILFGVAALIVIAFYFAKRYSFMGFNASDILLIYLIFLSFCIPLIYTGAINLVTW